MMSPDPRVEKVMEQLRADVRLVTDARSSEEVTARLREIVRHDRKELPGALRAVHSDLCNFAREALLEEDDPLFAFGRALGFELAASFLDVDLGEPVLDRAKRWEPRD